MNIAVALLSLLHLGHFAFLRSCRVPRTPALPHIAASMQIQCNVVKCLSFHDAPPASTLSRPAENALTVTKCGSRDVGKYSDAYRKLPGTAPSRAQVDTRNSSNVGECGVFSSPPQKNIFNVIKCNHFQAQPPAFTLNSAQNEPPRPAHHAVSGRRSSVVGRRQMLGSPTSTIIAHEQAASRGLLPKNKR